MLPLVLLALGLQVEGLVPGESARSLGPAPPTNGSVLEELRRGRVLDAFTGAPVAGARVESWTEEVTRASGGLRLVGEARADGRGLFMLPVARGGLVAEKLRARAPGYLAFSGVVGDLELVRLFPAAERAAVLELRELGGAPIEGALVTTTYSCAHDVPAFELRSDARGRATLLEHGLQDHTPELRVRAAGFGGLKYLDGEDVLARTAAGSDAVDAVVWLARRPSLSARVLDEQGEALAHTPLHVHDGDGFHVVHTDAAGRFVLAERFDGSELYIEVLEEARRYVFSGPLPAGREVALRIRGEHPPEEVEQRRVRLSVPEAWASTSGAEVTLFHPDGWWRRVTARDGWRTDFPAGTVLALAGETFSGWSVALAEGRIRPGERLELALAPPREPVLEVRTPAGEPCLLYVQAGEDSIVLGTEEGGATPIPLPPGVPVVVLAEATGWLRRARLDGLAGDVALDLTGEATLVEDPRPVQPSGSSVLRVRVLASEEALADASLEVRGPGMPKVEPLAPGRWRIEAAAGSPVLFEARVPGHAPRWARALSPAAGEERELAIEPQRLARLEVASAVGLRAEPAFEDRLDALEPGPLELVLALEDGRRILLELELRAGETRHLRIAGER